MKNELTLLVESSVMCFTMHHKKYKHSRKQDPCGITYVFPGIQSAEKDKKSIAVLYFEFFIENNGFS